MTTIRSGLSRRGTTQWSRQYEGGPRYMTVPLAAKCLVVEDALPRILRFRERLRSATFVSTADAAIKALTNDNYDFVFLDRDLSGRSLGEDVANHLASVKFNGLVVCHSGNPFGSQLIEKVLKDAGVIVECVPFEMLGIVREIA
jgi:Cyclic-phosphate processing Receiver domain